MEKELGLPKPGDLLIGVIEFFAVLMPGLIAAALVAEAAGKDLQQANTLLFGGLITAGWVLGHVLYGIGSFLDPLVYDPFFKPNEQPQPRRVPLWLHKYLHKNDELHRLANEAVEFPHKSDHTPVPGGMYQWARAWLNFHHPKATADLDRLEADSKLFRSLAVLCGALIPVFIIAPEQTWGGPFIAHRTTLAGVDIVAMVFSLWRYCDLRNKMIRQCYLNYVQLRFEMQGDREKALTAGHQS